MAAGPGGGGTIFCIPEELPLPLYDWAEEDEFMERLLEYMRVPLNSFDSPPSEPMVFKYPDPCVNKWSHCCFAGCDLRECGCCKRNAQWCPHSMAPYGRAD